MGLTAKEKRAAIQVTSPRYKKASKKQRGIILDEFVALTGYERDYAATVLRKFGKSMRIGNSRILVSDTFKRARTPRQRTYDILVVTALIAIWYIMDCICGKRLAPMLKDIIPVLEKHHEIQLDETTRAKLLSISAATIDRLLKTERKKHLIKGRSHTKPGTLLKHQIPVRTFAQWDENKPGFVEMDLVGHEGGNSSGEFAQTLNVTDIATGWTESQAVRNKAQRWVFEALTDIRARLPFDLLGIDSDNGAEFINDQLYRYCKEEKITFTRARSSRKNDNCFIEQKNYSVIRRAVGYMRHDTPEEVALLNELYGVLRLYSNFFQPVMKLLEKSRIGSKVRKRYDTAQTPYQRVLASSDASKEAKKQLRNQYRKLNPAELKRTIENIQNQLLQLVSEKQKKTLNTTTRLT
jgi:hypothetical protein